MKATTKRRWLVKYVIRTYKSTEEKPIEEHMTLHNPCYIWT